MFPDLADYRVQLPIPVLWGDMDSLGHVNNTRFVRWFESARVAYLDQALLQRPLLADGVGPILAAIHCNYRRQVVYPDTVTVGARITRLGNSSMTMEHRLVSHTHGRLAAEGESVVVMFDYKAQRPVRISRDVRAAIEAFEGRTFGELLVTREEKRLRMDGQVAQPQSWSFDDLVRLDPTAQVADVRTLGAKRPGTAIRLSALLSHARIAPDATHVGLHSSQDNFHASIPLDPVRDKALVIYALDGQPLPDMAGGPFRFYVPDHAACHAHEIDECSNVKFLDRIELTAGRGYDNRPQDDDEHARLHASQ